MTAVVMGGGGFVGRPLVQALRAAGMDVVRTSRTAPPAADLDRCDVTDPASIRAVIAARRPAVVINLATVARGPAEAMVGTNVVGVHHLLDAVRELAPSCRVVIFGSAAEYGDLPPDVQRAREDAPCAPRSSYGLTKLSGTRMALAAAARCGLALTVVRPFNVVGPGCPPHLLVGAILERMFGVWHQHGTLTLAVGRTDTARDFVSVDDLAHAVAALVTTAGTNGVVNVCSGVPTPIATVLETLTRLADRPISWRTDPALVRSNEPLVSVGDPSRLAALTGFSPRIPLDEALATTWTHAFSAFQTAGTRP